MLTVYDTTMGSQVTNANLETELIKYLIYMSHRPDPYNFIFTSDVTGGIITGKYDMEENIPIFNHPFYFINNGKKYLFLDLRQYIKTKEIQEDLISAARDRSGLTYSIIRYVYNLSLIEAGPSSLVRFNKYSSIIFSSWVSSVVSNVLAFDPAERLKTLIVAHHYYNLLSPEGKLNETDVHMTMHNATKISGMSMKFITDVYSTLDNDVKSSYTLVENIKAANPGPKSKNLTLTGLINSTINTWFGPNSHEAIACGLEHKPTWMGIIYSTLTDRSYQRTGIARLIDNTRSKTDEKMYIDSTRTICRDYGINL